MEKKRVTKETSFQFPISFQTVTSCPAFVNVEGCCMFIDELKNYRVRQEGEVWSPG